MMDIENKLKSLGVSSANIKKYLPYLIEYMPKYRINTEKRINFFLSQLAHESNSLTAVKENLNYTAEQILKTWPIRFKTIAEASPYAKKPSALATKVYSNRMGNTSPSDAFKYIGRGLIQLTGRSGYASLKAKTGIDFVSKPELVEQPRYAVLSAVVYWQSKGLNEVSDSGNFELLTKKINGGLTGLKDRLLKLSKLEVVKNIDSSNIVLFIIFLSIFAYAITHNKN